LKTLEPPWKIQRGENQEKTRVLPERLAQVVRHGLPQDFPIKAFTRPGLGNGFKKPPLPYSERQCRMTAKPSKPGVEMNELREKPRILTETLSHINLSAGRGAYSSAIKPLKFKDGSRVDFKSTLDRFQE
jgi:hypothetical protein